MFYPQQLTLYTVCNSEHLCMLLGARNNIETQLCADYNTKFVLMEFGLFQKKAGYVWTHLELSSNKEMRKVCLVCQIQSASQ